MIVPMATGLVSDTLYQYLTMWWATTIVLAGVIVFALIKALEMYRASRTQHKDPQQQLEIRKLIAMIIWIGVAFVALAVLFNATIGPDLALLGDRLGLGYTQPLATSFNIMVLAVLLFMVAGVFALVIRKPSKRDKRKAAKAQVNTGTHEHVDH